MFVFRKNGHYYERVGKKGEPVCIDDEIPFDIPESWGWVRINSIREVYTGNSINKTEKETKFTGLNKGYNYIATKDVKFDNSIDYDNGVKIPRDLEKFRVASQGSVLLCIEGGSAGRKIGILNQDVCFGNKLACFKTFDKDNDFLFYYLQSPNFKEIFKSKKTGIIGGVGIAKLRNVLMPIPPFNEQKRIINKLRLLFPKINEYGFNEEKLDKLNSEFPDKLKSSILQEAIQGKLVPQDSNDEPASVLLEKIKEEKEILIKEKKIKRNKKESYIFKENNHFYEKIGDNDPICIDEEIPFEISDSWEWCRMDNIIQLISGRDMKSNDYNDMKKGIPYITGASNIENSTLIINRWIENPGVLSIKNDILLTCKGTIGKLLILKEPKVHIARQIMAIRIFNENLIYREFILLILEYHVNKLQILEKSMIPGISREDVLKILVPLPPINEQKRIVKMNYELFNLIINLI